MKLSQIFPALLVALLALVYIEWYPYTCTVALCQLLFE